MDCPGSGKRRAKHRLHWSVFAHGVECESFLSRALEAMCLMHSSLDIRDRFVQDVTHFLSLNSS